MLICHRHVVLDALTNVSLSHSHGACPAICEAGPQIHLNRELLRTFLREAKALLAPAGEAGDDQSSDQHLNQGTTTGIVCNIGKCLESILPVWTAPH